MFLHVSVSPQDGVVPYYPGTLPPPIERIWDQTGSDIIPPEPQNRQYTSQWNSFMFMIFCSKKLKTKKSFGIIYLYESQSFLGATLLRKNTVTKRLESILVRPKFHDCFRNTYTQCIRITLSLIPPFFHKTFPSFHPFILPFSVSSIRPSRMFFSQLLFLQPCTPPLYLNT